MKREREMPQKITGGATSAVAASSHAACARFRGTDPLVTGVTRRKLAASVGFKDAGGKIPQLRWMRARLFETLVRDPRFASRVATTAVGNLGLDRPTGVKIADAEQSSAKTADILSTAHRQAVEERVVTLIHRLAIPFPGFDGQDATETEPDFALVVAKVATPGVDVDGSWLVVGDAKDYQRVRGKIDDSRMLKGYLQIALGAESAAAWSGLPPGMDVHMHGVLAVPFNASLLPTPVVEDLTDHRAEVRMRVEQRRLEAEGYASLAADDLPAHLEHLKATYNPSTCSTCDLFLYCRSELRASRDPNDVLIEIGIPAVSRPMVVGLVDGITPVQPVAKSLLARVSATVSGDAEQTGRARLDPAGEVGTVEVVALKSDGAALGIYGLSLRRVSRSAPESAWAVHVFTNPDGDETRREVMGLLGTEIRSAIKELRGLNSDAPSPVHIVVPDGSTADLLVSMADSVAGAELSRLRWTQDIAMNREALTFDGEPAKIPPKLPDAARYAVSFLLEEDRARTMKQRSPIVTLQNALSTLVVAGGPESSSMRLDFLSAWAFADGSKIDFRALDDRIESSEHTPGLRPSTTMSDKIHLAFVGDDEAATRPAKPDDYEDLVRAELAYKAELFDEVVRGLSQRFPISKVRDVTRAHEADAQGVWRRRLTLQAFDLVRFSRTGPVWRNDLVPIIEADERLAKQVMWLTNPQASHDAAVDAGTRELATATVLSINPLTLRVNSRRIGDGSRIVMLHRNGSACVEQPHVTATVQITNFKFDGLSIGPLHKIADDADGFVWEPQRNPGLAVGDEIVVANFEAFSDAVGNKFLPMSRPKMDEKNAPKQDCDDQTYEGDPAEHQWCCKPHAAAEAEYADVLAQRRLQGLLNPQVWPPILDREAFDAGAATDEVPEAEDQPLIEVPDDVTMDELE